MPIPREAAFAIADYETRLERVQRALAERKLDAILVFSPHNIYYLSGMDSENLFDFQCLIVPARGEPALVIFDFEMGRYENSCWLRNVRTFSPFDDPIAVTLDAIGVLAGRSGTLGVERRSRFVTAEQLRAIADGLPAAVLEDCFGIVEECRLIKSPAEIAYMRRAAELTDRGVEAGYAAAAAGKADYEIGAAVTAAMYRAGSDTVCWGPIVAAGYRAGCAHSTFNGYRLKHGDTVFLELTGEVRRYVAPLMRTAVLGSPGDEIRRVAEAVPRAIDVIVRSAGSGARASDVARAALETLEPVLGGMVFHHYFGYPVGVGYPASWIEQLGFFLRVDNDRPLKSGMVFHLPMSLRKYGEFAVNLSQTIVVGEDGAEPLSHNPARLQVIG